MASDKEWLAVLVIVLVVPVLIGLGIGWLIWG